jgi:hypothetical protein
LDVRFQKTGTPTGRPFWPEVRVSYVCRTCRTCRGVYIIMV